MEINSVESINNIIDHHAEENMNDREGGKKLHSILLISTKQI